MLSVEKNILKIQRLEYVNDSKVFITIGTGLLLNNLGHFVTAKHVIDLLFINDYVCIYDKKSFSINRLEGINSEKNIDIAIFSMVVNDRINPKIQFLTSIVENSVIGEDVKAIGFLQAHQQLQVSKGIVMSYDNGYYNIQNINLGKGFSGSPVFQNQKVVAFVSNYQIFETQTICKACSINKLLEIYRPEDYKPQNVEEFYINKIINEREEEEIQKIIYEYKKQYITEGDPLKIIKLVEKDINIFDTIDSCNNTIGYADMLQLAGNLLVNSQYDEETVLQARKYLVKSTEILNNYSCSDVELLKKKLKTEWLRSITHKQLTDTNEAHKILYNTINTFPKKLSFEIGLPLFREVAILEGQDKNKNAFDFVKNNINFYKHDIKEIFHTYRRLFEFNLFLEKLDECDNYLPTLNLLFEKVKKNIPPVYTYTLWKNLFHYYYLKGDLNKAKKLSKKIRNGCEKLNLKGQISSLDRIELLLQCHNSI